MEKEPLNHSDLEKNSKPEPPATESDTNPVDTQPEDREKTADEKPKKGFFGGNSKTKKLQEEIDALKHEKEELRDKALRAIAELDNFRKRTRREKEELVLTASEGLMTALLPVLDDMNRAQANFDQTTDLEALRQGFELIMAKLKGILERRGLEAMEEKGSDFDPDRHEAIAEVPAPAPEFQGKVIEESEKGYLLNDKIIRHARVVVGK